MKKQKELNHIPNLTGGQFICLEKDLEYLDDFDNHFTLFNIYNEAIIDSEGTNYLNDRDDSDDLVLLIDDYGLPLYVDLHCFLRKPRRLHPLLLMSYNIN